MTYYSENNQPLSKKLEKQINEDILMKSVHGFINHLQENYKGEKLSSDKILDIFIGMHSEYALTANLLIRRLQDTGKFPRSKLFKIGKKAVRLYHIR